jgi:ATP-dependent Clp protease ATP-binding subunit ClpC
MVRVIWIVLVSVALATLAGQARKLQTRPDFERYAIDARRSLFFARAVVSELGAPATDTEHLLSGLLKEPTEPLRALFAKADLSYDRFRQTLQAHAQPIPESVEIPFTKTAFGALIQAAAEADRLRHSQIEPQHLLLGLLRQEGSAATIVLRQHGITLEAARAAFDTPSR